VKPPRPETVKRRKACLIGAASTQSVVAVPNLLLVLFAST
jgi:hypothetical protein